MILSGPDKTSEMQEQKQELSTMDHENEGLAPLSEDSLADRVWASPNPYGEASHATERGTTTAGESDAPVEGAASDTTPEQGNMAQQDFSQLARRKSERKSKPSRKFDALEQARPRPNTLRADSPSRVERRASKCIDKIALSSELPKHCGKQWQGPSSKAKDDRWCWEEEELILLEWAECRRNFTSWKKIGKHCSR